MKNLFFISTRQLLGYPRRGALLLGLGGLATGAFGQTFPVTTYSTGSSTSPYKVAVGDLNGDGRLDLVTTNNATATVGVLLAQAAGGFAPVVNYSTYGGGGTNSLPYGLRVADVNGDGRLDVVTAQPNMANSGVSVLLGQGNGTLGAAMAYSAGSFNGTAGGTFDVAVGDVTGDGRVDLVLANYGNVSIGVLPGLSGGGFGTLVSYNNPAGQGSSVTLGDLNGDGRLDVVSGIGAFGSTIGVLYGQSNGTLGGGVTYAAGSNNSGYYAVAAGDVNGDGRLDVVTNVTNGVSVLLGQVSGFGAPTTYSTGAGSGSRDVKLADVNSDGRLDIVTENYNNVTVVILYGQAGGFAPFVGYSSGGGTSDPFGVAAGDLNGDGRIDLAAANTGLSTVGVLLNTAVTATPTLTSLSPTSGPVGTSVVLTGTGFTGATAVAFNGTAAPGFVVNSATQITVSVPAGASTGAISVTTPSGTATSSAVFTVTLPDLIVSTGTQTSPTPIPAGSYNSITVTGTGNGVLAGNVSVASFLTVQAGGGLSDGCSVISGAGTFTLAAGATLGICSAVGIAPAGTAAGAIQTSGATRSFSTDASYIYNGTAAQATGAGLTAQVRNLTTTNTNALTLTQPVTVDQVLTVASTGNLALNGQALTLLSDASGTALVVNGGTGVVTGGTATVQRYLTTTNPGLGYRHYSSPVSGNTLADLATATFTPVFSAAYNAATTPPPAAGFPTVLGYDQSRMNTTAYQGFDRGWFSPLATDAPAAGRGYAVNLRGTEVVDFTGTLRTGDYVRTLARATGSVGGEGLHLVGNPYPAPLDWSRVDATADRPGVDGAIYVFESSGPYAGAYRSYANGLGGSPLIGSSQGFFVRVSQGQTSGSLTFRNSQRLTSYGTQVAVRRGAADARPQVQLRLTAPTGGADDVFIYAEAGATPGLDSQFDASKLLNPSGLSLAVVATGGAELAIQGLPLPMVATVVPLTLRVPGAGTYALTAPALHSVPASTQVLLVDALTGQRLDLRTLPATGHAVAFSAAQAAQPVSGRFFLNLVPAGAPLASVAALTAAAVQVYPNPVRPGAGLTVLLPPLPSAQPVQVDLLNILGQVVRQLPAAAWSATGHLVLPTQGLAPGVYAVRVVAGAVSVAKRVVVE